MKPPAGDRRSRPRRGSGRSMAWQHECPMRKPGIERARRSSAAAAGSDGHQRVPAWRRAPPTSRGAPEEPARQLAQAEAGVEAAGTVVALDDKVDAGGAPRAGDAGELGQEEPPDAQAARGLADIEILQEQAALSRTSWRRSGRTWRGPGPCRAVRRQGTRTRPPRGLAHSPRAGRVPSHPRGPCARRSGRRSARHRRAGPGGERHAPRPGLSPPRPRPGAGRRAEWSPSGCSAP